LLHHMLNFAKVHHFGIEVETEKTGVEVPT
jgi:hypothetical protein